MTPIQAAQACSDSYDPAAKWDHEWVEEEVRVYHRNVEGLDIFAFRGSITALDWMRDAEGWPAWDSNLGFVHAGFMRGAKRVYAEIQAAAGPRVAFTGHSLGGARARVQAALWAVNGRKVESLITFGSPKPAFANLSRVIQKSGMAHSSYRNRNDPVPLVPAILPMWEHPDLWKAVDVAPEPTDLEPLRDHHIELYLRGVSP